MSDTIEIARAEELFKKEQCVRLGLFKNMDKQVYHLLYLFKVDDMTYIIQMDKSTLHVSNSSRSANYLYSVEFEKLRRKCFPLWAKKKVFSAEAEPREDQYYNQGNTDHENQRNADREYQRQYNNFHRRTYSPPEPKITKIEWWIILEIQQSSSFEEAKKSWKRLALQHHPDRGGDLNKMQEINHAWDEAQKYLKPNNNNNHDRIDL